MSDLLKKWKDAKNAVQAAESWQNKPKSENRYDGTRFAISPAHSKSPMFVRCGQHYSGGENYWESPKELNEALKQVLLDDFDNMYAKALKILKEKERQALLDCQSFIDEMQELINGGDEDV